jgi:endonuclease IV
MRFGTAGVPSFVSGDAVRGVRAVADLGLSAMEILFDDEVKMKAPVAFETGKVAKGLGIKLSVRAPKSIDLFTKEKIEEGKKKILDAARLAGIMNASPVVVSVGAGNNSGKVLKSFESIMETIRQESIETKIGLETSARSNEWGTLNEVVDLCSVLNVVPVLNFANLYARSNRKIKDRDTYLKVFEKIMDTNPNLLFDLHIIFSNARFGRKNFEYTPIDKSPPFEPLAEVLVKMGIESTLISQTPRPEVGAVKMREIVNKLRN